MGCDIHYHREKRVDGKWVTVPMEFPKAEYGHWPYDSFRNRSYGKFAFLAGVRNYSAIKPIAEPRGFPEDASEEAKADLKAWDLDAHTASWLMLDELLAFNYTNLMEDRRCTRNGNGEGKRETWLEFLGEGFLTDLQEFKAAGVERLVFWFDN